MQKMASIIVMQNIIFSDHMNQYVEVDTMQCTGGKMAAVFLLTDTCVAASHASGLEVYELWHLKWVA
jgi:hypothetical protein